MIYRVDPTETPFISGIGKESIDATLFEWQTQALASPAANAQLDGDDVTSYTAVTPTVRVTNRAQISRKVYLVSGTEQAIKKAGRKDEVAYQDMLKGLELRRDMEYAATQNTTAVAGNSTTARTTRGLEGWIATNDSFGAGGASPNPTSNTAPTDGTQRAYTETILKGDIQLVYTAGGNPGVLMVGAAQKQVVSTFTGNSTRFNEAKGEKLFSAFDFYKSDFGTLKVVPNRNQRNRTAFLLDMELWSLCTLRPMKATDLAKTGDADKRMVLVEWGIKAKNEAGNGASRDLT